MPLSAGPPAVGRVRGLTCRRRHTLRGPSAAAGPAVFDGAVCGVSVFSEGCRAGSQRVLHRQQTAARRVIYAPGAALSARGLVGRPSTDPVYVPAVCGSRAGMPRCEQPTSCPGMWSSRRDGKHGAPVAVCFASPGGNCQLSANWSSMLLLHLAMAELPICVVPSARSVQRLLCKGSFCRGKRPETRPTETCKPTFILELRSMPETSVTASAKCKDSSISVAGSIELSVSTALTPAS